MAAQLNLIFGRMVWFLTILSKKWLRLLLNIERRFNSKFDHRKHNRSVIASTYFYNMVHSSDEQYYLEQYMAVIKPFLQHFNAEAGRIYQILDLACGQGRVTNALAACCSSAKIIGVDISPHVISQAKKNSQNNSNISYVTQDIADYVWQQTPNSIDLIVLLEVLYFLPNCDEFLHKAVELLRPGGLIIMGFRTQYFNALTAVRNRYWDSLEAIVNKTGERLWGGGVWFNWHTSEKIHVLVKKLGLEICALQGIGTCSGIVGDPHDMVVMPSQLDDEEKKALMRIEAHFGAVLPDVGRYIIVVARTAKGLQYAGDSIKT